VSAVGSTRRRRPNYRLRRNLAEAAALAVGIAVLIWTLVPIYNIVIVALEPWIVVTQGYWYLEYCIFGSSSAIASAAALPRAFGVAVFTAATPRRHLPPGQGAALLGAPVSCSVRLAPYWAAATMCLAMLHGLCGDSPPSLSSTGGAQLHGQTGASVADLFHCIA
jgi:hypothetical protein